jgi:hypothetical protein
MNELGRLEFIRKSLVAVVNGMCATIWRISKRRNGSASSRGYQNRDRQDPKVRTA